MITRSKSSITFLNSYQITYILWSYFMICCMPGMLVIQFVNIILQFTGNKCSIMRISVIWLCLGVKIECCWILIFCNLEISYSGIQQCKELQFSSLEGIREWDELSYGLIRKRTLPILCRRNHQEFSIESFILIYYWVSKS